jgi:hypothetical protein
VIYDRDEVVYGGMAGRDQKGSLRRRLRDHASGQIVNMFAQYLFLSRVQFASEDRIRHPADAKKVCRTYPSGALFIQLHHTSGRCRRPAARA